MDRYQHDTRLHHIKDGCSKWQHSNAMASNDLNDWDMEVCAAGMSGGDFFVHVTVPGWW